MTGLLVWKTKNTVRAKCVCVCVPQSSSIALYKNERQSKKQRNVRDVEDRGACATRMTFFDKITTDEHR